MKLASQLTVLLFSLLAGQAYADFGEWKTFEMQLYMKTETRPLGFDLYVQNEHGGMCYEVEMDNVQEWISILNPNAQHSKLARPCESESAEGSEWENTDRVIAAFQNWVTGQGGSVTAQVRQRLIFEKLSNGSLRLSENLEVSFPGWPAIGTFSSRIEKFERIP
jgi:hypothetical protein